MVDYFILDNYANAAKKIYCKTAWHVSNISDLQKNFNAKINIDTLLIWIARSHFGRAKSIELNEEIILKNYLNQLNIISLRAAKNK